VKLIDRAATHYSTVAGRVVRGVFWHSTQVDRPVDTFGSAGGWHFTISRAVDAGGTDAIVYRDVPENQCAWGVAQTDRWRPSWVIPCPGQVVSDANYSGISVEMESGPQQQASRTPYTDSQYAAVAELAAYLEQEHGPLWHVGHGSVQLDRTDPLGFDWARAGFSESDGVNGRRFTATAGGDTTVTDQERQQLQGQIDSLNGINTTLQAQLDAVRGMLADANSTIGALQHDVIPALQAGDGADPALVQAVLDRLHKIADIVNVPV